MTIQPPPMTPDDPNDKPIDLRALLPGNDAAAEAKFVGGVMERVGRPPRQRSPIDPLWGVWSLARPLLTAAAIVLALAGGLRVRTRRPVDAPNTVAEAVGIPPEFLTDVTESARR
jgi:hypothetical protein